MRKERQPEEDDNSDERYVLPTGSKEKPTMPAERSHTTTSLPTTTNRNKDRNSRYNNREDRDRKCVICNMSNHSTSKYRNLTTAQDAVSQAKNRNRNDNSQSNKQANFGNQQRPILSGGELSASKFSKNTAQ